MILGVILARGGSKRLPGKNIRILAGRPLIAWTILAAQASSWLDRVVVSSDSEDILEVAREYGAGIVKRPLALGGDKVTSYQPLLHATRSLYDTDIVVLLQPTSPLRMATDIDGCVAAFHEKGEQPIQTVEIGKDRANGAVYVATVGWLRDGGNWDNPSTHRYEMPPERSVDIDTLEDFQRAERLI